MIWTKLVPKKIVFRRYTKLLRINKKIFKKEMGKGYD